MCSHIASVFYTVVLLRLHANDEEMPEWVQPVGLKGLPDYILDHIGIELRWPHKMDQIFGALDESTPARGGPQANNKK
jgi:hypothetical protein